MTADPISDQIKLSTCSWSLHEPFSADQAQPLIALDQSHSDLQITTFGGCELGNCSRFWPLASPSSLGTTPGHQATLSDQPRWEVGPLLSWARLDAPSLASIHCTSTAQAPSHCESRQSPNLIVYLAALSTARALVSAHYFSASNPRCTSRFFHSTAFPIQA